ncbi:response regulator [Flavobacterium segetis]|uniref:response regulator n=1 Tax=Flavobacterium segetis TaxID=271157 RepID=UPI0009FE992B
MINQKLVTTILNKSGYFPKLIPNGEIDLDTCKTYNFDFNLIDELIPEMDGLKIARNLTEIFISNC